MAFTYHVLAALLSSVNLTSLTLTLLALALLRKGLRLAKVSVCMPNGPWGYPVLGRIMDLFKLSLERPFHIYYQELINKYGQTCSVRLGSTLHVITSDVDLIKKSFRHKDLTAKPENFELKRLLGGYGIINSNGELWKNNRRFLIHKSLGLRGSQSTTAKMSNFVRREVIHLIKSVLYMKGERTFDPQLLISNAASNVISSILMSKRFSQEDAKFKRFMFLFDEGFRLFNDLGLACFLPLLRHLPGLKATSKKLRSNRDEMLEFVRECIDEHKTTFDSENPRDLMDHYIAAIMEEDDEVSKKLFLGRSGDAQLEQITLDLFSAGVETVKNSILWGLLHLLHNPEVMKKIQAEIADQVGSDRMPEIEDMLKMPYTRATMYEVLRKSSHVPLGTPHVAQRDVEIDGHFFPKDAWVWCHLHHIHNDPKLWHKPEEFNPERFIVDGQVEKPSHFMPFMVGQRTCIGDQLAEKEFFLILTSLLQVFDLSFDANEKRPGFTPIPGSTLSPFPFKIHAVPRLSHLKAFFKTQMEFKGILDSTDSSKVRLPGL